MVEQLSFQIEEGGSIPTSPLQFVVSELSAKSACELNALWHSRLPYIHWSNVVRNIHYVCYVARYDGHPLAVGIWSTPVAGNRLKDGRRLLELRRLAVCAEAPKFTSSWMIGVMVKLIRKKFPDVIKLISYQDTEVHQGTIYKASNWIASEPAKALSWTTRTRQRNKEQTLAPKIRWEYPIT
tara:strand:- start:41 stop:586 length:546 start_codon:yes stop_codon:yes gene_type:complete